MDISGGEKYFNDGNCKIPLKMLFIEEAIFKENFSPLFKLT